jgi:hypothetical protein
VFHSLKVRSTALEEDCERQSMRVISSQKVSIHMQSPNPLIKPVCDSSIQVYTAKSAKSGRSSDVFRLKFRSVFRRSDRSIATAIDSNGAHLPDRAIFLHA